MSAEKPLDRIPFVRTQQAVIDEYTGELVANGLVNERGSHRGIHPAAQSQNHPAITDLLANLSTGAIDKRAHCPLGFAAANAMDKVLKNDLPARRMSDLGMELQTVDFALDVADDSIGGILRPDPAREILRAV